MLDLNVTLLFQLANFFIAIFVLNILLIRPIREIIKKRNGVMDDMAEEAGSFEYQAADRLTNYEAELARARQDAGSNREEGRAAGAAAAGHARGRHLRAGGAAQPLPLPTRALRARRAHDRVVHEAQPARQSHPR